MARVKLKFGDDVLVDKIIAFAHQTMARASTEAPRMRIERWATTDSGQAF